MDGWMALFQLQLPASCNNALFGLQRLGHVEGNSSTAVQPYFKACAFEEFDDLTNSIHRQPRTIPPPFLPVGFNILDRLTM